MANSLLAWAPTCRIFVIWNISVNHRNERSTLWSGAAAHVYDFGINNSPVSCSPNEYPTFTRATHPSTNVTRNSVTSNANGKFILWILAHACSAFIHSVLYRIRLCAWAATSRSVLLLSSHFLHACVVPMRMHYTLVRLCASGYTCRMQGDEKERKSSLSNRMENAINRDERTHWRRPANNIQRETEKTAAARCSSLCCHRCYIQYVETAHCDWSSVIFRSRLSHQKTNPYQNTGIKSQFDKSQAINFAPRTKRQAILFILRWIEPNIK